MQNLTAKHTNIANNGKNCLFNVFLICTYNFKKRNWHITVISERVFCSCGIVELNLRRITWRPINSQATGPRLNVLNGGFSSTLQVTIQSQFNCLTSKYLSKINLKLLNDFETEKNFLQQRNMAYRKSVRQIRKEIKSFEYPC